LRAKDRPQWNQLRRNQLRRHQLRRGSGGASGWRSHCPLQRLHSLRLPARL